MGVFRTFLNFKNPKIEKGPTIEIKFACFKVSKLKKGCQRDQGLFLKVAHFKSLKILNFGRMRTSHQS